MSENAEDGSPSAESQSECVSVIVNNAVINSVICGFWVQWVSYEGETSFFSLFLSMF